MNKRQIRTQTKPALSPLLFLRPAPSTIFVVTGQAQPFLCHFCGKRITGKPATPVKELIPCGDLKQRGDSYVPKTQIDGVAYYDQTVSVRKHFFTCRQGRHA